MRPRLLVLAAPFGYGPASKALMVAKALSDEWEVTIFSARDAMRFIDRFRPQGVHCLGGVFQRALPGEAEMRAFDAFVSINNEPAVHHLVSHGQAGRTVFLDSILPWRSIHSPVGFGQSIRAYLVQDFPGADRCLHLCHAEVVRLTAPMVWTPATKKEITQPPGHVIVHLGGVTSPLVDWAMLDKPIAAIIKDVTGVAARYRRQVKVVGSRHLASMSSTDPLTALLGEVNPPEMVDLMQASDVLVTTPGLGAIYEAMACRVPVLVLPPMNSTQLHQYIEFTSRGFSGSCGSAYRRVLATAAQSVRWDRQTAFCIDGLSRRLPEALAELPSSLDALLGSGAEAARGAALGRQDAFIGGLSQVGAIDAIRELLDSRLRR